MEKIYVKFGDIEDPDNVEVYEAILDENIVKIVMPKANHPAAVDFARSVGFGEIGTYVVEGTPIGTNEKSLTILSNCKVIRKLNYNEQSESYEWSKKTPVKKIPENVNSWASNKMREHKEPGIWKSFMNGFKEGYNC